MPSEAEASNIELKFSATLGFSTLKECGVAAMAESPDAASIDKINVLKLDILDF